MMENTCRENVVVLVADKNMEAAVGGLLERHQSLQVRPFSFKLFVHPLRDPGCYRKAHEFLRPLRRQYEFALVLFDHDGCGSEANAADIEEEVKQRVSQAGWDEDSCDVIVIDPELEAWVWSDSPEVDIALGWAGRTPKLRDWLAAQGVKTNAIGKPTNPKDAMESALREVARPRSSSHFRQLAENVSLRRCQDRAFLKLSARLQTWFAM